MYVAHNFDVEYQQNITYLASKHTRYIDVSSQLKL
jgi:hypothetical protein